MLICDWILKMVDILTGQTSEFLSNCSEGKKKKKTLVSQIKLVDMQNHNPIKLRE